MKTAEKIVINLIKENIFPSKVSSLRQDGHKQFMLKPTFHLQSPSIYLDLLDLLIC